MALLKITIITVLCLFMSLTYASHRSRQSSINIPPSPEAATSPAYNTDNQAPLSSSTYDPSLPALNLDDLPSPDEEAGLLLSTDNTMLEPNTDDMELLLSTDELTLEAQSNDDIEISLSIDEPEFGTQSSEDFELLNELALDDELPLFQFEEESGQELDPLSNEQFSSSDAQFDEFESSPDDMDGFESNDDDMEGNLTVPKEDWVIEKGLTLKAVLEKWTAQAGWTLVWDTSKQQRMAANGNVYGTFEEAINVVFSSLRQANAPFTAEMYIANNVLRIRPR